MSERRRFQLGRVVGATVAATAGTPEKLDLCRSLGASVLVNYNEDDFVAAVHQATDEHGADVVLDNMGAAYLARNVSVLAVNGRLVVIGLQGGREAVLDLSALMAKRAALIATTLRARPAEEKATIVAAVREHVWPLLSPERSAPSSTGSCRCRPWPRRTASSGPGSTWERCFSGRDRDNRARLPRSQLVQSPG